MRQSATFWSPEPQQGLEPESIQVELCAQLVRCKRDRDILSYQAWHSSSAAMPVSHVARGEN